MILTVLFSVLVLSIPLRASDDVQVSDLVNWLTGLEMEGLYYLSYENGEDSDGSSYNRFSVNRGYFTLKKRINPVINSRITLDVHQDATGDVKVRLKYLYALLKFNDLGFITAPNLETGLVHTPWLDFEEHINYYRMQGTMYMERIGLFNSADFGVTLGGYFGGVMNKDYQRRVSKKYPGRYGSFALGVYNGGGYHASEENANKVIQGRLTLRPLPGVIPGLQFSYLGIFGKGNAAPDPPDWQTNGVMVSWEIPYLTLTGQYVFGKGNKNGSMSDEIDYNGYSIFAELKPGQHWRVIGRMDTFDPDTDNSDNEKTRFIAGIGYEIGGHNMLILDYDTVQDASKVKLTMQVKF